MPPKMFFPFIRRFPLERRDWLEWSLVLFPVFFGAGNWIKRFLLFGCSWDRNSLLCDCCEFTRVNLGVSGRGFSVPSHTLLVELFAQFSDLNNIMFHLSRIWRDGLRYLTEVNCFFPIYSLISKLLNICINFFVVNLAKLSCILLWHSGHNLTIH